MAIGLSRQTRKIFFSRSVQDGTPIIFYGVPSTPQHQTAHHGLASRQSTKLSPPSS